MIITLARAKGMFGNDEWATREPRERLKQPRFAFYDVSFFFIFEINQPYCSGYEGDANIFITIQILNNRIHDFLKSDKSTWYGKR